MSTTRRTAIALFTLLGPAKPTFASDSEPEAGSIDTPAEFPKQDYDSVQAVVLAAHFDYDKVKGLVASRPALAKAAWDWGFGDWESALGAASHMGRQDIAQLLVDHGAQPNLFTHAMMGRLDVVKATVEAIPGVQRIRGPHDITLLQHAAMTTRQKTSSAEAVRRAQEVVEYLESVGDADLAPARLEMTDEQKQRYVGGYRYGEQAGEVLHVTINRRGQLAIGLEGQVARFLRRVEENGFAPDGATEVRIRFQVKDGQAAAVTVHDPEPIAMGKRI